MQTKSQKKDLVKDLAEKIKNSKAVVFSDFKGLSVKNMTLLRRELKVKEIDFQVLKKTLITLALKDAGIKMDACKLKGQIAVAVSAGDEVEAAKIIAKACKASENLKMLGGILGKEILSDKEVASLAKLPSKDELLAKLVGTLNAPISSFANVLAGNIRGLVQVLKGISEKSV